jgi:hypothetical protein
MDAMSILGGAACLVVMCGVMMWAMMRFGHRGKKSDDHRGDRTGHTA